MNAMSLSRRSLLSLITAALATRTAKSAKAYWVYVGANTRKNSKGIYVSKLDAESGAFTEPRLAAEALNPLFLTIHPNGRTLYAADELPGTQGKQGGVSAYSIDPASGKLTFLNQAPSRGSLPIYLDVDKSGKTLLVANYGSGSVAAPISDRKTPGDLSASRIPVPDRPWRFQLTSPPIFL